MASLRQARGEVNAIMASAVADALPRRRTFPASMRMSKRDDTWTMTPRGNIRPGRDVDVIYGINQNGQLADYGACGQLLSFNATFSGRGPNPFTDETPDHIVVGLNHRTFFDENGDPTGNAFVGIAIGLAGPCDVGVCIEWGNDELGVPPEFTERCFVPIDGTRSLSFLFEAFADGRANVHIVGSGGIHTLSGDKPHMASPYAGAAVAGLGGIATPPYAMALTLSGPQLLYTDG